MYDVYVNTSVGWTIHYCIWVCFFLPVFGTSFLKHSIGGRLYNSIFRSSQKIERLKSFHGWLFTEIHRNNKLVKLFIRLKYDCFGFFSCK